MQWRPTSETRENFSHDKVLYVEIENSKFKKTKKPYLIEMFGHIFKFIGDCAKKAVLTTYVGCIFKLIGECKKSRTYLLRFDFILFYTIIINIIIICNTGELTGSCRKNRFENLNKFTSEMPVSHTVLPL